MIPSLLQDYFGDAVCDVSSSRALVLMMAREMDRVTNNNDWSLHSDVTFMPRYYPVRASLLSRFSYTVPYLPGRRFYVKIALFMIISHISCLKMDDNMCAAMSDPTS